MKISIFISLSVILLAVACFAQDVPFFERGNAEELGLPRVLVDRWGCSAADIDRNGWPDIYNNKWRGRLPSEIYMNYDGHFTDIYGNSPELKAIEMEGNATRTPVLVDFDNDGDRDLMIGFDESHNMFRNDDNVFVDITADLGMVSKVPGFVTVYGYEMSAWIDWDNDGDLDALVAQTNNPDYIFYRNDGDAFVDIAADVGLAGQNEIGDDGDRGFNTCRIQWIDWDNDGDPDLSAGWKLFRNDDGFLNDVSEEVGFLPFHRVRFHEWFDYDLDGDFDFMVLCYEGRNEVWRNENGTFVNATQDIYLDLFTDDGLSTLNVGDFDNDGDQDMFFSINDHEDIEAMLLNEVEEGARTFISVAQFAGFADLIGDRKGAAILDYDMDGLLDIFSPSLEYGALVYHNLGLEIPNNWIGFDLWGTKSNKDALGTLVTCYAGGMKLIRYTKAAQSWKMQDNPYVHFGIGQATSIDSVVIRWPMGDVEVLTDLEINKYYKIEELASVSAVERPEAQMPETAQLYANYPNPFNPSTTISYQLAKQENVTLSIFNLMGEEIITLVNNRTQNSGQHKVVWDGKDTNGLSVSAGLYLYQIKIGNYIESKKMAFIK
jgi:hypothetical protein